MEEDWCLLSDDEEFVPVAPPKCVEVIDSEPESESEAEAEPEVASDSELKAPQVQPTLSSVSGENSGNVNDGGDEAVSLDDIDILALLRDAPALRVTPPSPQPSTRQQHYSDTASNISDYGNNNNDDEVILLDDIDISTLLQDSPALREYRAPRSSVFLLSLLSAQHRSCRTATGRCVEVVHSPSRKRAVKLAFCPPRAKSFPARLRAEMPSTLATIEPPGFTPLTVITKDQSMQVDFDELDDVSSVPEPRASRLEDALKRSMESSNALKTKSQDYELVSFRLMKAEALLVDCEYRRERDHFKLGRLESGLELAKKREKVFLEAQGKLEVEMQELRQQNEELKRLNAFMAGDLTTVSLLAGDQATTSFDDLEKLEISLSKGMDAVRAAIRAKYKQAIARKQEETLCVACLSKPATVVLVPCRHQVLCSACAVRVSSCPIDREDIHDKLLTFGLNAYKE